MVRLHTVTLDDHLYHMGYKVVTEDMRSLGLRGNPNVLEYPVCEWYHLSSENLQEGFHDFGGIWVARTPANARRLQKYMLGQHSTETRVFKAALDDILYANDYRVKTSGVFLFEEIV